MSAEKKCILSELRDSYPKYTISKNKIELTPAIDVDGLLEKIILEMVKDVTAKDIKDLTRKTNPYADEVTHIRLFEIFDRPSIRLYFVWVYLY